MIKAEGFVGTTIVQLFSFIRINVIHHQADIILCKIVKACSFGKDSAYQFMIYFDRTLLVWTSSITIKYSGP